MVETSDRTVSGTVGCIRELPREVRQAVFSRDRVYAVDEPPLTCDARAACIIYVTSIRWLVVFRYKNALRPSRKSGQFENLGFSEQ